MIEEIAKQLAQICAYNDQIPPDKYNFLPLLEKWKEAKSHLTSIFEGQVIYTHPEPVTFTLSEEEKKQRLSDFIDHHQHSLGDDGIGFLESNFSSFFENKVSVAYEAPDGKYIQKGSKIIKALSHFINDEETLDKIQTKLSMIMQEGVITGTLCLSVHPIDFMSLSENCHNWRSCHALDGEYHTGNFSYMVDNCTIVAYLKTSNNVKLPHFPESVPWNDKIWRTLFFIPPSENCIFAARQYPFFNRAILDIVRDIIISKMFRNTSMTDNIRNKWYPWTKQTFIPDITIEDCDITPHITDHILIGQRLFTLDSIVKDNPNSLMYNDLLYSNVSKPWYTSNMFTSTHPYIKVGGEVKCPICNESRLEKNMDNFCCSKCSHRYKFYYPHKLHCSYCGDSISADHYFFDASSSENYCLRCARYIQREQPKWFKENMVFVGDLPIQSENLEQWPAELNAYINTTENQNTITYNPYNHLYNSAFARTVYNMPTESSEINDVLQSIQSDYFSFLTTTISTNGGENNNGN